MKLNSRNVRTIFHKELRDTLRDRRTLFAAIILPVLINPLLFIFMFMLMTAQTQEQRKQDFRVAFIGEQHAPKLAKIVRNFVPPQTLGQRTHVPPPETPIEEIAEVPPDARKVTVIENIVGRADSWDANGDGRVTWDEFRAANEAAAETETTIVDEGQTRAEAVLVTLADWFRKYDVGGDGMLDAADIRRANAIQMLDASEVDVVLAFPENFESNLISGSQKRLTPEILYLGSSDKSGTALDHVRGIIDKFVAPLMPMDLHTTDVRTGSRAVKEIAKFIPYLIILLVLTAAFTPAIDLMAGEKERGTIETLLISPTDRREIILGKFLCVTVIAVAAAALNLISLGATLWYIGGQFNAMATSAPADPGASNGAEIATTGTDAAPQSAPQTAQSTDVSAPPALPPSRRANPFPSIPIYIYPVIFLLMLPAAALFGAVALAISAFAKSHKEGQYYITPVMMVALPLAMISLVPGIKFSWQWGLLPIANFALLYRDIMTAISTGDAALSGEMWGYIIEVTLVTGIYAALALRWATANFYREDILFREAEEFNWQIWKTPGPPRATPSGGSALLAFALALILFFFVGQSWQLSGFAEGAEGFLRAHLMTQVLLIAGVAIALKFVNKYDWRRLFPLGPLPHPLTLFGVAILMPALAVLLIQILAIIQELSGAPAGPVPTRLHAVLGELSLPMMLVFFALVPGICEEILFRGYIFAGFTPDAIKDGKKRRADGTIPVPWEAIAITAVLFGVMHLEAVRIPITAIGGLFLGWIAWRSRSLIIAMLAHAWYNSSPLLLEATGAFPHLVAEPGALHIAPVWLGTAIVVAVGGLWLIRLGTTNLQHLPMGARIAAPPTPETFPQSEPPAEPDSEPQAKPEPDEGQA